MIKTIIFDIGNVLIGFQWWKYICSIFPEDVARIVTDALWKNGHWEEFDRGVLKDEEIVKLMVAEAPDYEKEILTALAHAEESLIRYDYAIPWVKQLKEMEYQVLFLSNYSEFLMERKPEVLDFIPYMDGGLFSCHAKVIKPDRAIYEKLCEKYNLTPEECLFVDDNPPNVKAAKELGMHAIRFEGYEKNYDEIMDLLKKQER